MLCILTWWYLHILTLWHDGLWRANVSLSDLDFRSFSINTSRWDSWIQGRLSCFESQRTCTKFSSAAEYFFAFPYQQCCDGFWLLSILANSCYHILSNSHPKRDDVVAHCSLDLLSNFRMPFKEIWRALLGSLTIKKSAPQIERRKTLYIHHMIIHFSKPIINSIRIGNCSCIKTCTRQLRMCLSKEALCSVPLEAPNNSNLIM